MEGETIQHQFSIVTSCVDRYSPRGADTTGRIARAILWVDCGEVAGRVWGLCNLYGCSLLTVDHQYHLIVDGLG